APGMALLGMDKVGEFQGIADEEHRRVITDNVPVTLLAVETQCKTRTVTFSIGRTSLSSNCREAQKRLGFLADLRKRGGAGVFGQIIGDRQRTEGGRTLCMYPS